MIWPFHPLGRRKYRVIMADNPWSFRTRSLKGAGRSPQAHYACMTIDEIFALPVGELADDDCWLWLWCINPMMPQAHECLRRWGFAFVTEGAWGKTTATGKIAVGTGFVLRGSHEPFIIAKRGAPPIVKALPSLFLAPRRQHSRKPDEAYRRAEIAFGDGPRADLFAREHRPGWDAWGDQVDHFGGLHVR